MPSSRDRSPPTPSPSFSGRRLISKIASPFASKARNITDYFVEVDDPHKQYSPGDAVRGSVKLRVVKPTRVTHIVVCLHGFVQVFKNPGSPGEGFRSNASYVGSGRGTKTGEYFGNGFASLFEDEVVLCGDGRLADGSYQFQFELEFPDRDLPSSIDFERGTITYMITATITRPATISPTMTCDRKVYFVERIDISPLAPPQPRTITLEPMTKRSRAKHQARKLVDSNDKRSHKTDSNQQSDRARDSQTSSDRSTQRSSEAPASPSRSNVSFESRVSSDGQASQQQDVTPASPGNSEMSRANQSKTSLGGRTITATVELLNGGCLRGDNISIRINVDHAKPIKSLYGVIVTLYRQARVDMHPAIPLGPTEKGISTKYEEYYPRSITGLGGLSLSGAGSNHIFRKDLAQVMAPLFVNPTTMSAEINTKVRVPEEAFPTISTVPGAMISFKYYVEVVLDIQGKLSGQDRNLGTLNEATGPFAMANLETSEPSLLFAPPGSNIVDTTTIRREKAVVTCNFEVIVGTRDSKRRKGKRRAENALGPESESSASQSQAGAADAPEPGIDWSNAPGYIGNTERDRHTPHPLAYHQIQRHTHDTGYYAEDEINTQPPPFPLPQMPDESNLSEKDRMRLAETRLLPSQPPGLNGVDHHDSTLDEATAPYLPGEMLQAAPSYASVTEAGPSEPPPHNIYPHHEHNARAPEYQAPTTHSILPQSPQVKDDKQELERLHLLSQASAPPGHEYVDDTAGPSTAPVIEEPSAPAFDEVEDSVPRDDEPGPAELPHYQR